MVMCLKDLKRDLSIKWATIESHVNQGGDSLYNFLNQKRNLAKTALDSSRRARVEAAAAAHERSLAYAKALTSGKDEPSAVVSMLNALSGLKM